MAHGDLSLKNVLISNDDETRICDMGACFCVSTLLCSCAEARSTRYVRSPELFLGGKARTSADVWAIGVIAMAFFTGKTSSSL